MNKIYLNIFTYHAWESPNQKETEIRNENLKITMTLKSDVKDLIQLSESRGWEKINKVMQDEILQLALSMARSPDMTQQQMDFQRGAIWAAEQLLNVPERLIHKLEGELALEDATYSAKAEEGLYNG